MPGFPKNSSFEITGTGLKLIAAITMLIDHIGAGILYNSNAYYLLRAIGRMAFPIYCYMLVEGFLHTRNIKKYALRLLAVAVISEVPFDFLFRDSYFYFWNNNVLWELLLGLLVLYGYSMADTLEANINVRLLIRILILVLGMLVAHFAHLDYSEAGICCISAMYFWNGSDKRSRLLAFGLGVLILTLMSSRLEVWAFLMLIPMYFYEGNRGADNKALRIFFYLFYPVHLIILGIVVELASRFMV